MSDHTVTHEDDWPVPDNAPRTIGPYRVLEQLGEGGMGVVYKAEQRSPIRRTVALKVIKLGFDTREVIARFDSERQALARMDHPNIAKVLDAGTTDTGRPYFVMEFVGGKPITGFCDDNKLPIRDRLALFIQVCDAISHAHTKAIIHRDIKAGNVLAYIHDGKPTIKVIDFGIAKALTADRLTDRTFSTELGRILGTYDSMSPEQADGSPDIDTRTDVYSLGVLLYELLTGAKPFDHDTLARAADHEIKRIIREIEPPRPSTRLSLLGNEATRLAQLRQSKLDALSRQLRSELEWIPLKAMRKDRARRYASALQLAEDVRNYLDGRPLLAGPERRAYRLQKFAQRHRRGIAVFAGVVGVLVAGTVSYIRGIRAEQRRTASALAEADQRRAEADAVKEFLTEDVLAGASPERMSDKAARDQIVKVMLDPAAAAVQRRFKDKPLTEAAVRSSLVWAYKQLGRPDLAMPHAVAALEIRKNLLGNDHPSTLLALAEMGGLLLQQGKAADAEPLVHDALKLRRLRLGHDHPETLSSLNDVGAVQFARGNAREAAACFRDALERRRRTLGPEHPDTLRSMNSLAAALASLENLAEAEPLHREALRLFRHVLGDDHPETLVCMTNFAVHLLEARQYDEAEKLFVEALDRRRRVLGDLHEDTLNSLNNYGLLLWTKGDYSRAEPLFAEALATGRRTRGSDHPETLISMNHMGSVLQSQGKLYEAEPFFREALERRRAALGDDHPDTLNSINNLSHLLQTQGKLSEAEPICKEALDRCRRVLGDDHGNTLIVMMNYASLLRAQQRYAEAEPVQREVLQKCRRVLGDAHPRTLVAINNLGSLLREQQKFSEGETLLREAVERSVENPNIGPDHPNTRASAASLALCLEALGRRDDAESVRAKFGVASATRSTSATTAATRDTAP
jgi:serine/threonine protein kinase/Tfp pilus assembly protein PilF